MEDDWRLNGQEEYLLGKTFQKVTVDSYLEYDKETNSWDMVCPHGDHEHCSFCWAKFSAAETDLHSGYFTAAAHGQFVCEECFEDFKESFHWKVIE